MSRRLMLPMFFYVLLSVFYLGSFYYSVDPYKVVLKILPIQLLVLMVALKQPAGKGNKTRLILALVFCMLGDTALALEKMIPYSFELGLGLFLIGHLAYIATFWPTAVMSKWAIGMTIVMGCFAIYPLHEVWSKVDGILRIAMVIYAVVLVTMAANAVAQKDSKLELLGAGGLLFIVSDTLLVLNEFGMPFMGVGTLGVMLTYYAAQGVLAFTWVDAQQ